MGKALRYLLRVYVLTTVGSMAAIAAIAVAGTYLFRVEMFAMYYAMLPMFAIIFLVIYGFTLTTQYQRTALTFGCRRADYFWAAQAAFLLCASAVAAVMALAGWLPSLLPGGYYIGEDAAFLGPDGVPVWFALPALGTLGLLMLLLQPMGAAMGALYGRSKGWGTACLIVVMLVMTALSAVSLFVMDGTIPISGGVVAGVLAGVAGAALLCDFYFYRSNARAVVR